MGKSFLFAGLLAMLLLTGSLRSDIALTVPEARRSVIGGSGTIGYDRLRVTSITMTPGTNTITASVELFVSTDSSRPAIPGTLTISAQTLQARLRFDGLAFEFAVPLTGVQGTGVTNSITTTRTNLENALVNFGMVAGTVQ